MKDGEQGLRAELGRGYRLVMDYGRMSTYFFVETPQCCGKFKRISSNAKTAGF